MVLSHGDNIHVRGLVQTFHLSNFSCLYIFQSNISNLYSAVLSKYIVNPDNVDIEKLIDLFLQNG